MRGIVHRDISPHNVLFPTAADAITALVVCVDGPKAGRED